MHYLFRDLMRTLLESYWQRRLTLAKAALRHYLTNAPNDAHATARRARQIARGVLRTNEYLYGRGEPPARGGVTSPGRKGRR